MCLRAWRDVTKLPANKIEHGAQESATRQFHTLTIFISLIMRNTKVATVCITSSKPENGNVTMAPLFASIMPILAHENARPVDQGVAVVGDDIFNSTLTLSSGSSFFHGHGKGKGKGPFLLGKSTLDKGVLGRECTTRQKI